MITTLIIGLIVAMIFSAFFSGMEIAFVSSNRMLAEMSMEKNGLAQKCIALFYRHPNNFVSTMLVGNNISLVIYGILFAKIFDATLFSGFNDATRMAADTLLSTLVVLFTGEFLPKTIFKSNPNTMLTVFALPAYLCYVVLYPISRFATLLSKGLLRLLGIRMDKVQEGREFTKVDLDYLVQTSIDNARDEDDIDEEVRIFQNALDFSETRVRDCMVPRTEIDAIEDTATIEELKQRFVESGHSKIVVYHEDIDHIIGYVHSSEMFKVHSSQSTVHSSQSTVHSSQSTVHSSRSTVHSSQSTVHSSQSTVHSHDAQPTVNCALCTVNSQLIRPMSFVPETMLASKLMRQLMQQKKSLAVVVDEFGGTSGLVALEDIVEEIFGDIEDEHDSTNYVAKHLDNGEYLLSARLEIEKVNELFDLSLPESDDYMTVGGLILHEYQSFPKLNEVVTIGNMEFKIVKNTATKIELVRLKLNNVSSEK